MGGGGEGVVGQCGWHGERENWAVVAFMLGLEEEVRQG